MAPISFGKLQNKLFKKKKRIDDVDPEFEVFKQSVSDAYATLGINFSYHSHPPHSEDASERPSHYDIFSYWVASKLKAAGNNKSILDVGNTKIGNMINSLDNKVDALVLKIPDDGQISSVKYHVCDVSRSLPFSSDIFDVLTSPGTLHLIGLGRYGDQKDPYALLNFKKEIVRVLKPNGKIYLLMPLGRDQLIYGLHFIYSFETIQKIFYEFTFIDYMVDEHVHFCSQNENYPASRFSQDTRTDEFAYGEYKILYIEMQLTNPLPLDSLRHNRRL